jgi:heme-degrading monooxygenase HmoA
MSDNEVTFINVIEVEPTKQEEVVQILQEGTDKVISKRPGFISLKLFASKDGTKVVNIAQWKSPADIKATQDDPAAAEYAMRTAAIAKPGPGIYALVGEYTA